MNLILKTLLNTIFDIVNIMTLKYIQNMKYT